MDLEIVVPPTATALDIVSLAEMRRHLSLSPSNTSHDDLITDCLEEAIDKLGGYDGELNRTILPTTWRRWLCGWPSCRYIQLPYPPLIEVLGISYGSGSPAEEIDPVNYVVRPNGRDWMVPEIQILSDYVYPTITTGPRAIAITFRAGYDPAAVPAKLKRFIKVLAAHYFENREASFIDPRATGFSRAVQFGVDDLRRSLRVPVAYAGWE